MKIEINRYADHRADAVRQFGIQAEVDGYGVSIVLSVWRWTWVLDLAVSRS